MRGYMSLSVLIVALLIVHLPAMATEVNVTIDVKAERDKSGAVLVVGETNLPNNMILVITLSNAKINYSAQSKIAVENGRIKSGQFSDGDKPVPGGIYEIAISSPLLVAQPAEVKEVVGANGENLKGSAITTRFGESLVDYTTTQKIGKAPVNAKITPTARPQTDQEKRAALIQQWIYDGVLIKVEKPTELPRAYVGKRFYRLTASDKETVAGVILKYYMEQDPQANILILRDGYTNKEIGTFGKYGLRLE